MAYIGVRCYAYLGAVNVWVTFRPYTGYVESTMAFFGQPVHENVYRSWVELLFDVDFGMKVIQLVGLRASEWYGRMLCNIVEVHHVYVLELLT